jgi:hypothetical protein
MAFSETNVTLMEAILQESHDEGLCYDMRGPIADKIQEALARYEARDAARFKRNSILNPGKWKPARGGSNAC